MRTVLLWLEGPMQSWGAGSRFGRRDTLPFPTRSGVLGLLCSAMGRKGEQRKWLDTMKPLPQTVVAYCRERQGRPLVQPLLRDFHMVGSGYDKGDAWQDMLIPKKADGKRPVGSGTKLTYRYYLQDMAYACMLDIPDEMEEEVSAALAQPAGPIFLGRKSCIPSELVFRGCYDANDQAMEQASAIAADRKRMELYRVVPGDCEDGDAMTLHDVPVHFGLIKEYEDRRVTLVRASSKNPEDENE